MHQALEVVKIRAKPSTIIPAENFKLASFMECQSQSGSAAAWDYCRSIATHEEHYPVGDQIFQFTTTDKKTIGCLRAELSHYEIAEVASGIQSPEINRNFASLHPSQLPSWFFAAGRQWMLKEKCLRTPIGNWKEKNCSAVRGVTSRCYVGVKRRLDFHLLSDAKAGWAMTQYYNLRVEGMPPDHLVIEEKMILCKVFQLKGKDTGTDMHRHRYQAPLHLETTSPSPTVPECTTEYMERLLEGSRPSSEYTKESFERFLEHVSNSNPGEFSIHDGELVQLDGGREQKSRRKSEVWEHFTRVRTKDPKEVYAICYSCDGMLKAHVKKHGTSQLNRHTGTSTCSSRQGANCIRIYSPS